mmetsp:Transcript_27798/g.24594  ORF Transcript_27798/g.24594 Transcript_27798/m.24594 type:complete len:233 (-) Transcript_27798:165-863(-)
MNYPNFLPKEQYELLRKDQKSVPRKLAIESILQMEKVKSIKKRIEDRENSIYKTKNDQLHFKKSESLQVKQYKLLIRETMVARGIHIYRKLIQNKNNSPLKTFKREEVKKEDISSISSDSSKGTPIRIKLVNKDKFSLNNIRDIRGHCSGWIRICKNSKKISKTQLNKLMDQFIFNNVKDKKKNKKENKHLFTKMLAQTQNRRERLKKRDNFIINKGIDLLKILPNIKSKRV